MEVYTIGFGKHTAEDFFEALRQSRVEQLIDVRLNNVSQLAGFTKRDDLRYFLHQLGNIDYRHELELAPTPDLLKAYRSHAIPRGEYERLFCALLKERRVEEKFGSETFARRTALLCSEPTAARCHRRLVLEYLEQTSVPEMRPIHLDFRPRSGQPSNRQSSARPHTSPLLEA